jgi:Icc-related predicted phosphoesterase
MLKIGLIGDLHGSAKLTKKLMKVFKKEVIDILIISGDLGDTFEEIEKVMRCFKLKIPMYIIPGSHEPQEQYNLSLDLHRNVTDARHKTKVTHDGLDIVFLPGSDILTHTGQFRVAKDRRVRHGDDEEKTFFVSDTKKLIKDPKKTLFVTHCPLKCKTKDGIDVAHFGKVQESFLIAGDDGLQMFPEGSIVTIDAAKELVANDCPVKIVKENVGNQAIRKLVNKLKINYFVCGHIHEAGPRAITRSEKKVRQGSWSDQIFYNPGAAMEGHAGLLAWNGKQMKYRNLKL